MEVESGEMWFRGSDLEMCFGFAGFGDFGSLSI